MDWSAILPSIISSVITGLIGGVFTVIGVIITNKFAEKRLLKNKQQKNYHERPNFVLKSKSISSESDLDVNAFITSFTPIIDKIKSIKFEYDTKILDRNQWRYTDFELKNEGIHTALEVYLAVYLQKSNALFEVAGLNECVESQIPSYSVPFPNGNYKKGDKAKVRINYHKDMESDIHGLVVIYTDNYGNAWRQLLFPLSGRIERSHKTTMKEFGDEIWPMRAFECFEQPWLW